MAASLCQGGPNPAVLESWCYDIVASENLPEPENFMPTDKFLERDDIKKVSYHKFDVNSSLVTILGISFGYEFSNST